MPFSLAFHLTLCNFAPNMATYQEIEQVQDFSRFDGAITALFWIVSFACFVGNFYNPIFGLLSFVIGAASLVFAALRLKKFRDEVLDGKMSFVRGYGYSVMTYLYASLLFAGAQFVYFQFIDHGYLMNQYSTIAQTKEFIEMMQVYGIKPEDRHGKSRCSSTDRDRPAVLLHECNHGNLCKHSCCDPDEAQPQKR